MKISWSSCVLVCVYIVWCFKYRVNEDRHLLSILIDIYWIGIENCSYSLNVFVCGKENVSVHCFTKDISMYSGCRELWPYPEPCAEPRAAPHWWTCVDHAWWPGHRSLTFLHHLPCHKRSQCKHFFPVSDIRGWSCFVCVSYSVFMFVIVFSMLWFACSFWMRIMLCQT